MNTSYEWFCTLCEATFPHSKKDTAINHMWDQHSSDDPYRMYKWQEGEILELEERQMNVDPFIKAVCASNGHKWINEYDELKHGMNPAYRHSECLRCGEPFATWYNDWCLNKA